MLSYISAAAILALASASNPPTCGPGQSACPSEYPCCSADGVCGNGYVCLGGCDPRFSNQPGSCVAMPVFSNATYDFHGTDGVSTYQNYLGNATASPFSYLGNVTTGDNNALRIQLFKGTGGSTVSSSHYLWYGKTTIKMKTSGGGGVVSDFILLSNVKDEIDYEFVGYDLNNGQTNYYWQGELDYNNMVKGAVSSNTEENYHEYSIDWQENQITWSIDGNVVRTLQKSDTKNSTTGEYNYPQTPARIQFGLWPAGDLGAEGTKEWAGGSINWNAGQAATDGYFYVEVESLTVEPYDPPSNVNRTGSKSYVYTGKNGMESDIAITDEDYILLSSDGTGNQLGGPFAKSSSASSSSSAHPSTSASSSRPSSSSATSSSAHSSSAHSSSASHSSSAAHSSSASSSHSSSAHPSSSHASSSHASSSVKPSSSAAESSSAEKSSSVSVTTSSEGTFASATAATSTASESSASSSEASSSASSSSTAAPKNGAAVMVAPAAIAAIIPALLL